MLVCTHRQAEPNGVSLFEGTKHTVSHKEGGPGQQLREVELRCWWEGLYRRLYIDGVQRQRARTSAKERDREYIISVSANIPGTRSVITSPSCVPFLT